MNKAHEFKTAEYVPTERGLVDQGGFTGMEEGFAQNGFRNFTSFFGTENVDHIDYWSNLNGNDYLWSYGCGAGSYTSAGGLDDGTSLTTAEVALGYNESTFTMLFGSYFGDWDVSNNLMRAIIANGSTLTCSWAGRPNWHYHTMARGDNIGASALMSQDMNSDYLSLTFGGGFVTGEGVHVAQLGDPSLRMYYIIPPTDVEVINNVSDAELSWTASADGTIDGYNIYRRPADGLWVKVNESIVAGTSFVDADLPGAGEYYYLVKAVKHKTNSSGTFYNESLCAEGNMSFFASTSEQLNFEWTLYPNPSTGMFTIQSDRLIESVEIYSPDGQLVQQTQPNTFVEKIDLQDVIPGVYFVKIQSNGLWRTKRVVVK
ncbi:MAG: T9SS type A sorting domain-containing protein [Crocinitomicaceae bacterium]